jgi:hypothetical protein
VTDDGKRSPLGDFLLQLHRFSRHF